MMAVIAAASIERALEIGVGGMLIVFVCLMAARAPHLTRVVERYYAGAGEDFDAPAVCVVGCHHAQKTQR
jgi:hypothetical protein